MKARPTSKVRRLLWYPLAVGLAASIHEGISGAQATEITRIIVPDSRAVTVTALNQQGNVAGYFTDPTGAQHPFFWNGTVIDQGTLGGRDALAFGLNDFNQTTGYSFAIGDTDFRAFVGVDRTLFDLGTLGGNGSLGQAINNRGAVTGYSFLPGSANFRAIRCESGSITDLGTLGGSSSAGVDINDLGQVAGDSRIAFDVSDHAFLYDGGVMYDVGTFGGEYSHATDLNNLGQVTGVASTFGETEYRAFVFAPRMLTDLGTLGGPFSIGYAINDQGVVAGDSSLPGDQIVQGFVWSDGVMTSVGHLGSQYSGVWDLNNSNQVVGISTNAQGLPRAFLWQRGTILDLNDTLPPGSDWVLEAAYFINDQGQIVGTGQWQGQHAWYRLEQLASVNHPPTAQAGPDQIVECSEAAVLNGGDSSDPDGDPLSYEWFEGDTVLGVQPQLTLALPVGTHALRLRVTDRHGASADDNVTVTVADRQAPEIRSVLATVVPTPPSHHPMVSVRFAVVVTDACNSNLTTKIVDVDGNGPTCKRNGRPDWKITGDLMLDVRADGGRGPRVYTIVLRCTNEAQNSSTRTVELIMDRVRNSITTRVNLR